MTKYIKFDWPEYQEYMEHPYFNEMSYYISEDNSYMIPEELIEEVESKLIIPKIYENTSLGTVTLYETHAVVNGEETFYYIKPEKGNKLLVYLLDKQDFMITTCKTAINDLHVLIEESNLLEGVHFEIVGCHE